MQMQSWMRMRMWMDGCRDGGICVDDVVHVEVDCVSDVVYENVDADLDVDGDVYVCKC